MQAAKASKLGVEEVEAFVEDIKRGKQSIEDLEDFLLAVESVANSENKSDARLTED